VIATFNNLGADLHFDPHEYGFLHLVLSYALHGVSLDDNDFRNLLGMTREDGERLYADMQSAERAARESGDHWLPPRQVAEPTS